MKTWEENYLAHYGITGQKWGVRRFQNEDRTLTEAGKERYRSGNGNRKESDDSIKEKSARLYKLQDKYFYDTDYQDPYYYAKNVPSKIAKQIDDHTSDSTYKKLAKARSEANKAYNSANSNKLNYESSYDGKILRSLFPKKYKEALKPYEDKLEEAKQEMHRAQMALTRHNLEYIDRLNDQLKGYSKKKREELLAYAYYCIN